MRRIVFLPLMAIFLTACATADPPGSLTSPTTGGRQLELPAIHVRLSLDGAPIRVVRRSFGEELILTAAFDPVRHVQHLSTDNELLRSDFAPDDLPPVSEMRYCLALDDPCRPGGEWTPFRLSLEAPVAVDWYGPRTLWIGLEFRAPGGTVPGFVNPDRLGTPMLASVEVQGRLDEDPLGRLSAAEEQARAAASNAYPVSGWVELAEGASALSGLVGDQLSVRVELRAESPGGTVERMRIAPQCVPEVELEEVAVWRPFAATLSYPAKIEGLEWTVFSVGVQFEDAAGNRSMVACDSVVIEGLPGAPAP